MSQVSDFGSGDPIESQASASDAGPTEKDKVGPGRPPRDTRWKKGCPSPNPRGRPRKDASLAPDVRKAFEEAISKKVPVKRGEKTVLMNRIEIGFEQLLNQCAKGDRYARKEVMDYADRLGIDFLADHKQGLEEALTPNYQAILEGALARRSGTATLAPAERVLASAELLDDDVETDGDVEDFFGADTTSASPPQAASRPKIPEPEPIPGKTYPKPFHLMTPLQRRIHYPEWWEQYGELWEKCGRP
jgi:hypothetical protein